MHIRVYFRLKRLYLYSQLQICPGETSENANNIGDVSKSDLPNQTVTLRTL